MDAELEKSAMRKIYIRLLPFAFIAYSLCYVDRINSPLAAFTLLGHPQLSAPPSRLPSAASPHRPALAGPRLFGQPWTAPLALAALTELAVHYAPLSDMRASSAYRLSTAQNLLYRFYLETREVDPLPASSASVFA